MTTADILASCAVAISLLAICISLAAVYYSKRQTKATEGAVSPFITVKRVYHPEGRKRDDDIASMSVVITNQGKGVAIVTRIFVNGKDKIEELTKYSNTFIRQMGADNRLKFNRIDNGQTVTEGSPLEVLSIDVADLSNSVKDEYWRQFQDLYLKVEFKTVLGRIASSEMPRYKN